MGRPGTIDAMSSPGGAAGLMVETEADVVRRQALRRMRIVATGLLVVAAIVYLLTLGMGGFWGFVNAGAEASMVGAMADWFAVTALFRHPLGLPVPHTALIPKRKDELGASLEVFVQDNFLQEDIIRERLGVAMPSLRLALWLSDEPNAKRVVDEVSAVVADGLSRISNRHIIEIIQDGFVPRFREEQIAPLLGGTLQAALDDQVHHGLVDLALVELHGWLEDNQEVVTEVLGERAPWWTPQVLREPVTNRIHVELVRWIADIRDDPDHRARKAIDAMLADLADNLQHDEATMERAERLKERVLDHPGVIDTAISIWDALRRALTSSLRDPEGVVRRRALDEVVRYAQKVVLEESLQRRYDALASDVAVYVVRRYGKEATTVITHTIQRWDGKQAASRIELFVGRDLQFIRINGTIVGGLVGVIIHTVSVLVT